MANLDGVQFEVLRKKIDPDFNERHDQLEQAYYGSKDVNGRFNPGEGWRNAEIAKQFEGKNLAQWSAEFNLTPPNDPANAKTVFDLLHADLWLSHKLIFHEENQKEAVPYSRDLYDNTIRDGLPVSLVEEARQHFRDEKTSTPNAHASNKAWATLKSYDFDETATD